MEIEDVALSVDFPFPGSISSLSLLVEVSEVSEESQKHEHQVELQNEGETQRASERRGERDAEQTGLIEDGQGLDHSHRCKQKQSLTKSVTTTTHC